jgi:Uma2 family endonuclease
MSIAIDGSLAIEVGDTLADLVHELGDVPLRRILRDPPPGTATEDDLVRLLQSADKRLCELIDGVLVEKPMGWYEARLAALLVHFIEAYLEDHDCGVPVGADGPHRLPQGRVRLPDVAFVRYETLPPQGDRFTPIAGWAPDLCVEILSESNTRKEMERKLLEYFVGGVKLVWYVDPETRTVAVYRSPTAVHKLTEDDTVEGEDILPGFQLSIRTWFQRADRGLQGRHP